MVAPLAWAWALPDAPPAKPASPEPLSFEQACFLTWQSCDGLSQEQARQFFEPVAGQPFQFAAGPSSGNRTTVTLTGLARLRAPWAADSVLRIAFHATQPLKLHFWGQQAGVVLGCFRNPQNAQHVYWTAMRTWRRPGPPPANGPERPAEEAGLALLAGDDQRADRSVSGDYQVRYQAGMLVLTKGDIRVLTVPLETPPRDVYLEGQGAVLRQVALEHGGPAPEDPIAPPRVILQGDRPAELPWTACPSGRGSFQRLDDGSLELSVKEKTTLSTAVTMPLFRAGLYEVIFQLDRPSSDSGIFLADDQGRAIQGVEFYLDKTPGLVAARFGRPTDPAISSGNPPQDIPLGYTPQQPWWRLVLGAGTMRCFTSGDGLHWGQALATLPQGGNFLRIGLYCQPGSQPRRIGLRRLIVREIDALMALAPVELEERAEASPVTQRNEELTDLMVWQSQVLGSTPPGVDGAAWRRACGLATLVHGAETPLAKAILEKLLEEELARPMSLPAKLRLLDQATLLWNTWTNEDAQRLVARWDRLGMALLREGGLQDLEDFRKARMTASFWTQDYRVEPFDEALARGCLVSLVCRSQWNEAERLCGQLRFWNQPADPGAGWPSTQNQVNALVNWINPLAENGEKHDPQSGARAEVLLRHPVSVPTSKEAFNLATDFARRWTRRTIARPSAWSPPPRFPPN